MLSKNRVRKPSRFLRAILLFAISLGIIALGVRALGQSGQPPTNPFSDFADVFPGQPDSAIGAHPFSCLTNSLYGTASEKDCKLTPPNGLFSNIRVMANRGNIIQITFSLRDETLQIGDLSALWNINAVRASSEQAFFDLPDMFVIAKTRQHDGDVSLFLPVWDVSFTDRNALGVS